MAARNNDLQKKLEKKLRTLNKFGFGFGLNVRWLPGFSEKSVGGFSEAGYGLLHIAW